MNLIKICYIILGCIMLTNSYCAHCQSIERNKILEYEYKIMNSTQQKVKESLMLDKGLWQKNNQNYIEAIKTLSRINLEILNDSLKYIVIYNQSFCYFMINDLFNSKIYINKLRKYKSLYFTKEAYILELSVYSRCNNFKDFKSAFLQLARSIKYADTAEIYKHTFLENSQLRSSKLGKIIPGIDLRKNNFIKEGNTNIGLTVISLGNFVFQSMVGMYSFGIITGIYPFLKFKFGGKVLLTTLYHKRSDYFENINVSYMQNEIEKINRYF